MSKVIAIFERPSWCFECPCFDRNLYLKCRLTKRFMDNIPTNGVPDFCPLKEVPKKKGTWEMDVVHHESADLGEHVGWNECMDYVLGGEIEE